MTTEDVAANPKRLAAHYLEEFLSARKHIFCRTVCDPSLLGNDRLLLLQSVPPNDGTPNIIVTEPTSQHDHSTTGLEDQKKHGSDTLLESGTAIETRALVPLTSHTAGSLADPASISNASAEVHERDDALLKDLAIPTNWDLTGSVDVNEGLFFTSSYFFITWKGELSTRETANEKREVGLKWFRKWDRVLETADRRKLLRERFQIWLQLRHPNVLPFLGVIREDPRIPTPLCMVSPWMENGELLPYLRRNPDADKLGIVLGIAKGLEYLHGQDPFILHGDIRASNVLVNSEGEPVLCDYGVIDLMKVHVGSTTVSMNWARWRAPEGNTSGPRSATTPSSDMFSFGMLCYELLSDEPPFYPQDPVIAMVRMMSGARPLILPEWKLDYVRAMLCEVMESCWQQDPVRRPSASLVVQKLKQAKSDIAK